MCFSRIGSSGQFKTGVCDWSVALFVVYILGPKKEWIFGRDLYVIFISHLSLRDLKVVLGLEKGRRP
jgi:hypothetical protein